MTHAKFLFLAALLGAVASCAAPAANHEHSKVPGAPAAGRGDVGFIVAAPDRGFLGNEEVRDAAAALAKDRNVELVFVTDDRTHASLATAVDKVRGRGAKRAVVLPLFLTAGELGYKTLVSHAGMPGFSLPISVGQRFGQSYLAVERRGDRLRSIPEVAGRQVVVVGYGGADDAARAEVDRELTALAAHASAGLDVGAVKVVSWLDNGKVKRDKLAESELGKAMGGTRPAVVPFELGPRMDSMMSFTAMMSGYLGKTPVSASVTPDPLVSTWLVREANRHLPLTADDVGVVYLAHGADYHWNESMERAVDAVAGKYKIEFAFSMADQPIVERAIRRLEDRGARAIVVVRVFGLRDSFLGSIERMLGLDADGAALAQAPAAHGDHGHGHGHGHGPAGPPPPRIRSSALFTTTGGLEDSALFAEALLDRALALSKDPSKETIVLTAHGAGSDAQNAHWKKLLASLVSQMRAGKGAPFRAIEAGTWREDWPDKREPEIAAIRALVENGSKDGGRVIVIPARTTSEGPEKELLAGLRFELGSGFAPHPLFERWVEEQITAGIAALGSGAPVPAPAPAPGKHEHDGHGGHAHH
jgi:sirohydrochlorin ferrochelatase